MLLRGGDVEKYPEFVDYLYYRFPNVMQSKTIVKNMATIGKLDKSAFRAALTPGMPPYIEIKDFNLKGYNVSDQLGRFNRDNPGKMVLASQMIERFNESPYDDANYFHTAKGSKAPVVGGVLLHLLTHFGYYRAGLACSPEDCPGGAFEADTYGNWLVFLA